MVPGAVGDPALGQVTAAQVRALELGVLEPVADGPAKIPVIGDGCVGCGVCEMICPVEPTVIVIDLDQTADTLDA